MSNKINQIARLGGELDKIIKSGLSDDETLALALILDLVVGSLKEKKVEIFDKRIDAMGGKNDTANARRFEEEHRSSV